MEISQSAGRRLSSPRLVIPTGISPRLSRSARHFPAPWLLIAGAAPGDGHLPRWPCRRRISVERRWSYPIYSLAFRDHPFSFACSPRPNPTNMERSQEEPSMAKNDAMVAGDSPELRATPQPRP